MKKLWIAVGALAVIAGGAAAWYAASRPEWTTSSPEALAAYWQGRQAQMKFYGADAAAAFERAIRLDPEFVVAKVALLDTGREPKRREKLLEELRSADRSRLNERELFLLDLTLAGADQDEMRRSERIQSYLARHPRDPWALMRAATSAWDVQDWETAERLYEKLLEVDPNWVLARNNLGYIAMAQGRFAEAEDQFRTYRYAAPDQANPHDSLGELLILLGRYDEARAELEEALRVRPDFCASYWNLFRVEILDRRPEALAPLVARAKAQCDPHLVVELSCFELAGRAFLTDDFDAPWRDEPEVCAEFFTYPDPMLHALALRSGRRAEALAMEETARRRLEKAVGRSDRALKDLKAMVALLEGQRLMVDGNFAEAIGKLREVDSDSTWWAAGGGGILKLVARHHLSGALEASGDPKGAAEVLERLRAVNPSFAEWSRRYLSTAAPPG